MPKIGNITYGKTLEKTSIRDQGRQFIFCQCPVCDKTRWLSMRETNKTGISRCQSCCGKDISSKWLPHGRGDKSPHWKGGKTLHHQGYIICWISENDPYYPMATHKRRGGGTIFEHRYVMAQSVGRCLTRQEHVHHRNGAKDDNRIENLELISQSNHILYKSMCSHCSLREEIKQLKKRLLMT